MPNRHQIAVIVLVWTLAGLTFPGRNHTTATAAEAAQDPQPPAKQRLLNGKDLGDWRVISKFNFEDHGIVKVEKGVVFLGKGQPATGIAWRREFPRTDYEVRLDAMRIEGDDFFCGMTFPVGKKYCTLILGGWGGGTTGLSNLDDEPAVENDTSGYHEFKPDKWYRVRLRVTDEKIQAWIDKQKIIDVVVKGRKLSIWWEQEPARPFGITTWNTTGALKNIEVTRLKGRGQNRTTGPGKKKHAKHRSGRDTPGCAETPNDAVRFGAKKRSGLPGESGPVVSLLVN